jgi:bifunctional non-homologous end joining protein LigD
MPPKKPNGQRPVRLLRAAPTRKSPAFITPMAAQVVKKLPEGADWVYELKFDGYRALIIKHKQQLLLARRNSTGRDLPG